LPQPSKKAAALRLTWERAVERDKPKDALAALEQLELLEPKEARWPHRAADVLRRLGRMKDAELAYDRAMAMYEKQGFVARAVAVAKIIATLNPARESALDGADQHAARALRAATKPPPVMTPPPSQSPPHGSRPAPAATSPSSASALAARLAPSLASSRAPSLSQPAASSSAAPAPPTPHVSEQVSFPAPQAAPLVPPPTLGYIAGLPAENVRLVARARPLLPALDVGYDEVRFENAPEYSTDVDLSEFTALEDLPSDYGPAAEEFDMLESPTAERLALMSGAVLFNGVPLEVASEIARAADLVDLSAGSLVYREGSPADALYILVDGAVQISVERAPRVELELTEGEVFGEACLVEGSLRMSDVRAKGPLLALRIPKSRLDTIVGSHPSVGDVLFELLVKRLVASTVQSSPLFAAFDPETRRDVASLFEVRRAPAGTLLKEHGKRGDGLYILLVGCIERDRFGTITELAPGTMFGQSSLFSQKPEAETVRVRSEAVLLRLPTSSFGTFAMQFPPALAHLADLPPG
jgi:CRP-like cAMP-binding protein